MNQEIFNRITPEKPTDPYELMYWYLDSINLDRSCYWSPEFLEPKVRALGSIVEDLYVEWLRSQGVKATGNNLVPYIYLVLPYLSFRLLNSKPSIEVNVFKTSSGQKKRFIDCMLEEHKEIPDDSFSRAFIENSLSKFLAFLDVLCRRREQ